MLRASVSISLSTILALLLLAGCAATPKPLSVSAVYFPEVLNRFPGTNEPLRIKQLTAATSSSLKDYAGPREVVIMVHPAYSHFFRDLNKDSSLSPKFALMKAQFESEVRTIREQAGSGAILLLVVPGNYPEDSKAPGSYVSYLNSVTADGRTVFYLLSETSSSGYLPVNEMVTLYRFLQSMNISRVMIGGGYVGRCQREFYNQLTTYLDRKMAYVVPELSTVSPDDITDSEAQEMLESISRHDYGPVKALLDKKTGGNANVLSLPRKNIL